MRILFVRHGHPNYADDCLTPLGHKHASAAARRLADEGVETIFSSTCGRALETAQHLADELGLPVHRCDFMKEIKWGAPDGSALMFDGHPWDTADWMAQQNQSLFQPDWMEQEPFCRNRVTDCVQKIADATDEWLLMLGYRREGLYYRVTGNNTRRTVAAFGHGGASSAILSHLFNLPFPFVCSAMGPDYTAITAVTLGNEKNALVPPRFEVFGDARHIRGLQADNVFDR